LILTQGPGLVHDDTSLQRGASTKKTNQLDNKTVEELEKLRPVVSWRVVTYEIDHRLQKYKGIVRDDVLFQNLGDLSRFGTVFTTVVGRSSRR